MKTYRLKLTPELAQGLAMLLMVEIQKETSEYIQDGLQDNVDLLKRSLTINQKKELEAFEDKIVQTKKIV